MVNIKIEPNAKQDIKSIYQYIKNHLHSTQGAKNFLERTMTDIRRLADAPYIGMVDEDFLPEEYRYIISHKRYRIYYCLIDSVCHVLAIWDEMQDPQKRYSVLS